MSSTTRYISQEHVQPPVVKTTGTRGIGRLCARFFGLALIFAALGIWLAPGASWETEILILKAGVSFFFALTGLTLAMAGETDPAEAS